MNPHHRDKTEARKRSQRSGPYAAELASVRAERAVRGSAQLTPRVESAGLRRRDFVDVPVPEVLHHLLRSHILTIVDDLGRALHESRYHAGDFSEWQRLVLYSLTDGLSSYRYLVGAIASYLQSEGLGEVSLMRYLRVEDPEGVRDFVDDWAIGYAAGLRGEASRNDSSDKVWNRACQLGAATAASSVSQTSPSPEDALEVMAALVHYRSDSTDERELLHLRLPERLTQAVRELEPAFARLYRG